MTPSTPQSETSLDLTKVSTPRCAAVLRQALWKKPMRELAEQLELELGIMERRLREALAEVRTMHEAYNKRECAEAAERRVEREGLPWCEVHGPYRGSGCPQCFSAARYKCRPKGRQ